MPYSIYCITAPNGKSYVGVSKNVKSRWASHKRKARANASQRHPFYDAIRAFGPERFSVQILQTFTDKDTALRAEIDTIARMATTDRTRGYNVSDGGEYDAAAGGALFWDRIRADPESYADYIARLSRGCKKRGGPNVQALIDYNKNLPRRDVWKRAHRASRIARQEERPGRTAGAKLEDAHVQAMAESLRAVWAEKKPSEMKRWARKSRDRAIAQWAARSQQERDEVASKISRSLTDRYARDGEMRRRNRRQLNSARDHIDRQTQGRAASNGIKRFWEELKKDPGRYADYMARRNKSLQETISAKKNL